MHLKNEYIVFKVSFHSKKNCVNEKDYHLSDFMRRKTEIKYIYIYIAKERIKY